MRSRFPSLLALVSALVLLGALAPLAEAQIPLTTSGTAVTRDFNTFTGAGFQPTPATGQLSSNNYSVIGDAGSTLNFGGTATTGTLARGASTAAVSTGGLYSFGISATNTGSIGIQGSGSFFVPSGSIYVRYRNDVGSAIASATVAYDVFVRNDQTRASSFNFAYATGSCAVADATTLTFTPVPAAEYVSPLASTGAAITLGASRNLTVPDLSIASGDCLYLQFTIADAGGSGSRDELALDNLSVTPTAAAPSQTVTQDLSAVAGYRLLSTPVSGVTVADLAAQNLVQGVPAGGGNAQQQYPGGTPNLFTSYGNAGYTPAPSTGFVIQPGRGFFWQFYNQTFTVANPGDFGGGTSQSRDLSPDVDLTATGAALTATVTRAFTANAQNFYMVGNPFARPLAASAVSVQGAAAGTTGIQGGVLQAWQPAGDDAQGQPTGSYVLVSQTPMGTTPTALAVWQGVFAETAAGATPTFVFDASVAVPAAPDFIGRPTLASGVSLVLTGATVGGSATEDVAAFVRVAEGASAGWDALDASKLTPPGGAYALVAPVVVRDGARVRAALSTVPAEALVVPVSFLATEAGTYTLTATASDLPDGLTAELRDVVTGAVGAEHTFEAGATDWADRFEIVLTQRGATAGETAPAVLSLSNLAPNPTTRQAAMTLTVDAAQRVTATVVDALGRTVATVYDADLAAGASATIAVDASALAPGVYVVRVAGETFAEARRFTVAR